MEQYKENLNWKQWIPVYGMYRAVKDSFDRKPSLTDTHDSLRWIGSALYHAASIGIIIKGLKKLL